MKDEIVNEIIANTKLKDYCFSVANGREIANDLYQYFILTILETPEEKLVRIKGEGKINEFCAGIIYKAYNSNRTTFNNLHRPSNKPHIELDKYEYSIDEKAATIKNELAKQPRSAEEFYEKGVFKLYLELGSTSKVAAYTTIPKKHIVTTLVKYKKKLMDKLDEKQYKILIVVPCQIVNNEPIINGLNYHRQIIPHEYLIEEKIQVVMTYNGIDGMTDEEVKEYQLIQFLRQMPDSGATLERCKRLGVKTVLDIDDYWHLPQSHRDYKGYVDNKIPEQTEAALKGVDWVTTTTPILAKYVSTITPNVEVLPNAINTTKEQFQPSPTSNARLRFGWVGGVHHLSDIYAIRDNFKRLGMDGEIKDKWQFCLGGFSLNDFKKEYEDYKDYARANNKALVSYEYFVEKCVENNEYVKIEKTITGNYEWFRGDRGYLDYLLQYSPLMEHYANDKPYKRIWGKDVFNYATIYNEIDVSVIPLQDNPFNNCKSQLKIIEAGFMKKAVIVSKVKPYTIDCNSKNSILVENNGIGFYKAMRKLIKNPNMVQDLAEAMYETVKDKYHISTVNEKRKQVYKHIING